MLIGEGAEGRGGTKSCYSEKAWSSINHSILCSIRNVGDPTGRGRRQLRSKVLSMSGIGIIGSSGDGGRGRGRWRGRVRAGGVGGGGGGEKGDRHL